MISWLDPVSNGKVGAVSFDRELLSNALPAYEIGEALGQGGMGVVVSGQHRQLDRRVAIKQLPAAVAADPAVRRRFTAEARVLASLDHPHVVPVYDFVEREGLCLLVMELLPGGTLRSRVAAADGISAPQAVAVTLACLSGLGAAHRRGVLHRDVKPENMLFASTGVLKVTDFGIAKVIGGPGTVMTRVGDVLGTPAYIAPEQVRGGKLSPATDVYGVATMLYELMAGVLPFPDDGESDGMALLFKHAYEQPVPLGEAAPGVPDPVAAVVMRGLRTEPGDRFGTAEEFGVALAEAGAQAWGPGWLAAEQVPIMDAGPVTGAAGPLTGPLTGPRPQAASAAAATLAPTADPATGTPTASPAAGTTVSPAAGAATASPAAGTTASPAAGAATASPAAGTTVSPAAGEPVTVSASQAGAGGTGLRRKLVTAAVVVAVILVIVLAILLLPKLFHVYKS